jgi:hypothetical protein
MPDSDAASRGENSLRLAESGSADKVSIHPSGKARGVQKNHYLSDEQRRHAGDIGRYNAEINSQPILKR